MRLCTRKCFGIEFFIWKGVRCIDRISQYKSVGWSLRPYYNPLPSESVAKCVCAPRSVLASSFSLKRSPLYRKNLAIYICCPFAASLLQPIALWKMIKYVCAPRSVLEPTVYGKTSLLYWKNLAIYICRLLRASLLQPIAVEILARVHLCASKCLRINFFSENESAVSLESRNIRMLAASCVLMTTDCALNVWLLSSAWGKNCPDTLPSH
jgi:hypothetical protein